MDIFSYLLGKKAGGGGGEAVLINKSVTANGTYNASSDSADGYKKVTVAVPNSYGAGDEGKVVSNGALVAQGSDTVTENDTYDTTLINSLTVAVPIPPSADALLSNTTESTYTNNTIVSLRRGAFNYLTSATTIHLGAVATLQGADAFAWADVETLVMPALANGTNYAMRDAKKLLTFDAGANFNTMQVYFFNNCIKLNKLILRCPTVVTLQSWNAFTESCFKNGGAGGDIYVPSSLISSYKTASNWSTINGYGTITWHAIEGSIYETQYADGTPIS